MICFDKEYIIKESILNWNEKDTLKRENKAKKYNHFLKTKKWDINFNLLTKQQQKLLIKSGLIRIYDSLSNKEKTKVKKQFNLSVFSSKWYKLPNSDKKILLDYIFSNF